MGNIKQYRCTTDFEIPERHGKGYIRVEEGSIWIKQHRRYIEFSADNRLVMGKEWIEISDGTLSTCFEEVTKCQCCGETNHFHKEVEVIAKLKTDIHGNSLGKIYDVEDGIGYEGRSVFCNICGHRVLDPYNPYL